MWRDSRDHRCNALVAPGVECGQPAEFADDRTDSYRCRDHYFERKPGEFNNIEWDEYLTEAILTSSLPPDVAVAEAIRSGLTREDVQTWNSSDETMTKHLERCVPVICYLLKGLGIKGDDLVLLGMPNPGPGEEPLQVQFTRSREPSCADGPIVRPECSKCGSRKITTTARLDFRRVGGKIYHLPGTELGFETSCDDCGASIVDPYAEVEFREHVLYGGLEDI